MNVIRKIDAGMMLERTALLEKPSLMWDARTHGVVTTACALRAFRDRVQTHRVAQVKRVAVHLVKTGV